LRQAVASNDDDNPYHRNGLIHINGSPYTTLPQFCANCALRSALPVWFLFSVEWHCIKAVANNHKLRIRGLPCLKFVKMREFSETFKIRKKSFFFRITSNCKVFEFAQH